MVSSTEQEIQAIGERMKGYEDCYRIYLPRRTPLIIRIDGRSFHSLTAVMDKPWDISFFKAMVNVAEGLCHEIQGAKLAYIQSDEVSVLVTDYEQLNTQPWFGKNLQKVVSISAARATWQFQQISTFSNALFDSRAFILPKEEVCNYFIWRQQDATRNSIQSLGQAHFSHKELHNFTCEQIKQKLLEEKGVSWESNDTWKKRGATVVLTTGKEWSPDLEPPIFTQQRDYIEKWL